MRMPFVRWRPAASGVNGCAAKPAIWKDGGKDSLPRGMRWKNNCAPTNAPCGKRRPRWLRLRRNGTRRRRAAAKPCGNWTPEPPERTRRKCAERTPCARRNRQRGVRSVSGKARNAPWKLPFPVCGNWNREAGNCVPILRSGRTALPNCSAARGLPGKTEKEAKTAGSRTSVHGFAAQ